MERSGSQKALLVLSIIEIVGAALLLLGGLSFLALGSVSGMISPEDLAGTGVTPGEAGVLFGVLGIVFFISGVVSLLCGIFGIRAANDASKVGIVWVFTLIALILCVLGVIVSLANGTFQWSFAVDAIVSGIMFWLANNIKNQAA